MSAKRAFFSVFQKLTLFCCAMFFGITHAFSANLPSGYTELEYIESSGTQYINTGFAPTANYKHTIVFETLSSGTGYLCGTGSAGGRSGNVKLTGNNILDIYNNDSGTGAAGILGNVQLAQGKNTLVLDLRNASKSYVSLNGVNLETTNTNTYITSSLSVTLFGSGGANSVPLRIYESIIEQNGVVIAHFVPAKNSSGVIGMYDLHKKAFYTNAGTGEFTGGRAVCSNGELAQTYTSATGTVTQSGTPSPTNPIEPTFYQQGYMVLRKVGDVADSYDATTGKITRRVGVKELTGTEGTWRLRSESTDYKGFGLYDLTSWGFVFNTNQTWISSHYTYKGGLSSGDEAKNPPVGFGVFNGTDKVVYFTTPASVASTLDAFKNYLAQQYAAGTPVTVYYPLATSVEENWAPEQCLNGIKIATTAYNTARFSPVVNDLNSTIATIRSVVTNTINQTKAIADLQAKKQTRPDEQCPAGKKCLLVEDNNGTPHWYEIIENIYGLPAGYTALEYIQSDGNSWIDTGIKGNMSYKYDIEFQQLDAGQYRNWGAFNQQTYNGGPNMSLTYATGFAVRWTVTGSAEQLVNEMSSLDTNRHHLVIDNGYVTWDGVAKGRSGGHRDNYILSYNLFLGTVNPGGTTPTANAKSKYYSYKVWNGNGDLIQNFVPAKNSSGVVGMYDLADTNPATAFHTNKGTGTFIGKEF